MKTLQSNRIRMRPKMEQKLAGNGSGSKGKARIERGGRSLKVQVDKGLEPR